MKCAFFRDNLEKKLTPGQLAQAQELSRNWVPRPLPVPGSQTANLATPADVDPTGPRAQDQKTLSPRRSSEFALRATSQCPILRALSGEVGQR